MTELIAHHKKNGSNAEYEEAANVNRLNHTIAVEDKVKPRNVGRDYQHYHPTIVQPYTRKRTHTKYMQ